eukprot:gene5023-5681_t
MATTSSATNKKASVRWKPEMMEQLITCLHQYKTAMSYKNLDFDADKPIQYKELRLKMASLMLESQGDKHDASTGMTLGETPEAKKKPGCCK